RLTDVVRESAGGVVLSAVHYRYDALDRLIARDVDGAALYTVYAGDVVWADFTGAGDVAARYLYGDGADALLARWLPHAGRAWHLTDRLGWVRDVTNPAGTAGGNHAEYTA